MIYTIRSPEREFRADVVSRRGGLQVDLNGRPYALDVFPRAGTTHFLVTIDGTAYPVVVTRSGRSVIVVLDSDQFEFEVARGLPASPRRDAPGQRSLRRDVHAPMPGLIVSTAVTPGDAVKPGRTVAVMEAMKMQMEIRAPVPGTVVAVPAKAGEEVARGTVLVTIETPGVGE